MHKPMIIQLLYIYEAIYTILRNVADIEISQSESTIHVLLLLMYKLNTGSCYSMPLNLKTFLFHNNPNTQ